jgi:hypothetical protein
MTTLDDRIAALESERDSAARRVRVMRLVTTITLGIFPLCVVWHLLGITPLWLLPVGPALFGFALTREMSATERLNNAHAALESAYLARGLGR